MTDFSSSPIRLDEPGSPVPYDDEIEEDDASPIAFTQTSPGPSPAPSAVPSPVQRAGRLAQFAVDPTSQGDFLTSMAPQLEEDEMEEDVVQQSIIWGTNVDIDQVQRDFGHFLRTFMDPERGGTVYPPLIEELVLTQELVLNVSCAYLRQHDADLYRQAVEYPAEVLGLMDAELARHMESVRAGLPFDPTVDDEELIPPSVRLFDLDKVEAMRALNPTNIDQLVAIRGMVIRTSGIIPEMKMAFHECAVCHQSKTTPVERGMIHEPKKCDHCNTNGSMELVHNRCTFTDKQLVKLQETPDAIPDGDTPHTVTVVAYDSLVDVSRPGDRVEVTGVFRAIPIRSLARQRTVKSVFKTYIDVVHFKTSDKRRMDASTAAAVEAAAVQTTDVLFEHNGQVFVGDEDQGVTEEAGDDDVALAVASLKMDTVQDGAVFDTDETQEIRKARAAQMRELSQRPDIYDLLVRSLAPSIWQLDDVKRGILCLLFGGCNKDFSDQGYGRTRGDINILLCGDPATSKSQLLSFVHKLAPRGIYTSGKGSSSVGLTASLRKDPDTGEPTVDAGALVLSDNGVCCIDEFDKMSDTTRAVLHEVMEQQTVSIAKAGIVATLNARASILASANPIESRYNPNRSVVENLDLPPTLLSRFDLIYLVLDKADEGTDRHLAEHIVQLYWEDVPEREEVLSMETMTAYISYARKASHPRLSEDAAEALVKKYCDMRRAGASNRTVSATPRQLESMVRLSEALARMRLSTWVSVSDVEEASRLLQSAMQTAAIDPRTGKVDMDLIHTGRSATQRTHVHELAAEVKRFLIGRPDVRFQQMLVLMQQQSSVEVTRDDLRDALRYLEDEDFCTLSGDPRNQHVRLNKTAKK